MRRLPASPWKCCIASPRWPRTAWIRCRKNGAVITLLAVTGLSHRQSCRDISAITPIKTAAVFVIIGISTPPDWCERTAVVQMSQW